MRLITPTDKIPLEEAVHDPQKDLNQYGTLPNSIFLAGPINRDKTPGVKHWQYDAISYLEQIGFDGILMSPKRVVTEFNFDYVDQVEWEHLGLKIARVVCFWVPRNMEELIGLTTNVEFGLCCGGWKYAHQIIYGRPEDAPKNRYLDRVYHDMYLLNAYRPIRLTMEDTLKAAAQEAAILI